MTRIAIDFGSTNTKVAYFDEKVGKPRLLELGNRVRNIIPSLFYLPQNRGEPLVGNDAEESVESDPEGVISGLKKEIHKMGKIRRGPDRASPERIPLASHLFRHIRETCERGVLHGQTINECVLTVPATFEEAKQDSIRKAALEAGFEKVELIPEPVAAARYWLATSGQRHNDSVVVCDIGGGTTDFAFVRNRNGNIEVVPEVLPGGIQEGGNDIDDNIFESLINDYHDDAEILTKVRSSLIIKIRSARELFSRDKGRKETPISMGSRRILLTQEKVEACCEEFEKKVCESLAKYLDKCHRFLNSSKAFDLLLVGGGSRIPGMKQAIEAISKQPVIEWQDFEYAVVLGAVDSRIAEHEFEKNSHDKNNDVFGDVFINMLAEGESEKALELTSANATSLDNDDLFDLWIQAAENISRSSTALGIARTIAIRRNRDMLSTALLACSLVNDNRRSEALKEIESDYPLNDNSPYAIKFAWMQVLGSLNSGYIAILDKLISIKPHNPILLLAKAYIESNLESSIILYNKALQTNPHCISAIFGKAWSTISLTSNPNEKLEVFRKANDAAQKIAPNHALTRTLLSLYRCEIGDYLGSKSILTEVVQDSRIKSNPRLMSKLLVVLSYINLNQNQTSPALVELDEALKQDPTNCEALALKGNLYIKENNFVSALEIFDRGLAITSSSGDLLAGKGIALLNLGKFNESVKSLVSASLLQPTDDVTIKLTTMSIIFNEFSKKHQEISNLSGSLFLANNIPKEKEDLARSLISELPPNDNSMLLLYDSTFFQNCDFGFYITERHIVSKIKNQALNTYHTDFCKFDEIHSIDTLVINCIESGITLRTAEKRICISIVDSFIWDSRQFRNTMKSVLQELTKAHRNIAQSKNQKIRSSTIDVPDCSHAPANDKSPDSKQHPTNSNTNQAFTPIYEIKLGRGVKLELVLIPAGTFMMGSLESEAGHCPNETRHEVTISKPFYLGKYPVTQAQWRAVMGNNPSSFEGSQLPVESVSWHEVVSFCDKIQKKTGQRFRLPTEAEWEYACRLGTTTPFHFGSWLNGTQANCDGRYPYGTATKGPYLEKTSPVGSYPANGWGLHDMHGNVREWCSDWYGDYDNNRVTDPQGAPSGESRVLRGGSWVDVSSRCRAAFRERNVPYNCTNKNGFRVLLPLD